MKMTEKMKQELEEYMKKAGIELSDEELDEVSGGRGLTWNEKDFVGTELGKVHWMDQMLAGYVQYIQGLPEGSPEVSWGEFVSRTGKSDFMVTCKCDHCGVTVKVPLHGDYPRCSGCGMKIGDTDMLQILCDALH